MMLSNIENYKTEKENRLKTLRGALIWFFLIFVISIIVCALVYKKFNTAVLVLSIISLLLLLYILLLLIIESLLKRGYEVDHKTNKVIDRKLAILLIIFNSKKVFNEYVSDRSRFLYMTEELAAQLSKMVDQLPALFLIAVLPFLFAIVWIIKLPFWFIIKKNDRKFIAEFVENRDRNLIEA